MSESLGLYWTAPWQSREKCDPYGTLDNEVVENMILEDGTQMITSVSQDTHTNVLR
jgi:hypothetical protein